MFHRLKTLLTHTAIYGLGDVATSMVSFLLLPVFTRFLSPVEYGIIALLLTLEAITKIVFRWGIDGAFMRLYYDCPDVRARQQLASSIFFFLAAVNSALLVVSLVAAPWIARTLLGTPGYTGTLRLVLINTFAIGFFFIPLARLRIEQRSRQFATVAFSRSAATITARVVFVVLAGFGVLGMVLADLVVTAVFTVVLARWCAPLIRLSFSRQMIADALRFGLPRVPHGIAHQAIAVSDRYLLSVLATVRDVGVYTIGATFGLTLKYFLGAFQTAWSPFLFEAMKRPDATNTYRAVTTYVVALLVLLAAGLSAIAADLVQLMTTPEYHDAARIIPWIAIGAVLQGFYQVTSIGLAITKRTEYYPIATGAAAISSVGANLLLIPRFGIFGAAWANVISYAVLAAVGRVFSQRYYPIPTEWSRLMRIMISGAFAYAVAMAVTSSTLRPITGLFVRGSLVTVTYPLMLLCLGFFRSTELDRFKQLVTRRGAAEWPPPSSVQDGNDDSDIRIP